MSKAVQDLFTSIAPRYDFLNHFLSLSIDRRWREKAMEGLEGHPAEKILDLCAGTLDLTERLLQLFPNSQVMALDFSLAMLHQGQKKIRGSLEPQLVCGDGHHLPFLEESFDAVLCGFGIRNLEQRDLAAREIHRVLRPGGKLIVLDFFRPEKFISKLFAQTYGKWVIPRLGGLISKSREAYEYLQNSIRDFFTVEEYLEFLTHHGFKKITQTPLTGGIAHRVVAEV